jgi:hypothetical protein
LSRIRPPYAYAALAAATAVLLVLVASVTVLRPLFTPSLRAQVGGPQPDRTRVLDPVTIVFNQSVDARTAKVELHPDARFSLKPVTGGVQLVPATRWNPSTTYSVRIDVIHSLKHDRVLRNWIGHFRTQPNVSVAGYEVDGKPAGGGALVRPGGTLKVIFGVPMNDATTHLAIGGKPVAGAWSPDRLALTLSLGGMPGQRLPISVLPGATSRAGDSLVDDGRVELLVAVVLPSNPSSGIGPGFVPPRPLEIVVENHPGSKPQTGVEQADIVYEYLSEYSITRMTAIYLNHVPAEVGPVRSCRMINLYLAFAFSGYEACSGVSSGTAQQISVRKPPTVMDDAAPGTLFFRGGSLAAPHNLYTSGKIESVRETMPFPPPAFAVDAPHPDAEPGEPSDAPQIPAHSAGYAYDGAARQYVRSDRGAPMIDTATGRAITVKTVAVVHVPFHDAGWVEDDSGGAHSVWYDLSGDGPADIYSDGRVVHGQWHMGEPGQPYWELNRPMYFTDEQGRYLTLNSGLTWIHVVGNGQAS